jgi:hypothetical protein
MNDERASSPFLGCLTRPIFLSPPRPSLICVFKILQAATEMFLTTLRNQLGHFSLEVDFLPFAVRPPSILNSWPVRRVR